MADSRIPIFGRTIQCGSDELFDYICTPCDSAKKTVKAEKYCANCDKFYCKPCLEETQSGHSGHKVECVSDWGLRDLNKCQWCRGDGAKVSKHCQNHDQSCCSQCASTYHSSCPSISDVSNMAKGVYTSECFNSAINDVAHKIKEFQKIKSKKQDIRDRMQMSRELSLIRLESFQRRVDDIFKKLKEDAEEEINESFLGHEYQLVDDIESCEEIIANLRLHMVILESKHGSEVQTFLKLKQIRDNMNDYDMSLVMQESEAPNPDGFAFRVKPTILYFIENIDSLKEMEAPKPEQETLQPNRHMAPESALQTQQVQLVNNTGTHNTDENQPLRTPTQNLMPENTEADTTETAGAVHTQDDSEASSLSHSLTELRSIAPDSTHETIRTVSISAEFKYSELLDENAMAARPKTTVTGRGNKTRSVGIQQSVRPKQRVSPRVPALDGVSRSLPSYSSNFSDVRFRLDSLVDGEETVERKMYNIKLPGDDEQCNIQGMFGLKNGNILLSDTKNKKMKLIDQTYKVIAACELPAGPRGVTGINDTQAVTALSNKTLQFVDLKGEMRLQKVIRLNHRCYGISHHKGKLYVTEPNGKCVHVYDTSGHELNIISGCFESTQHVYVTRDGARIYVADTMRGLVVVNAKGALLSIASQSGLLSACGVCTDTHGNVYVSGWQSHNVMKFGDIGIRPDGEILSAKNGILYPTSIWFNSVKSEMVVSVHPETFGSDILYVFKL